MRRGGPTAAGAADQCSKRPKDLPEAHFRGQKRPNAVKFVPKFGHYHPKRFLNWVALPWNWVAFVSS